MGGGTQTRRLNDHRLARRAHELIIGVISGTTSSPPLWVADDVGPLVGGEGGEGRRKRRCDELITESVRREERRHNHGIYDRY